MTERIAAAAVTTGPLTLGSGALALIRPALDRLEAGATLWVLSQAPALREDLPAWCHLEQHLYQGCEATLEGDRHALRRGSRPVDGSISVGTLRGESDGPAWPDRASARSGFAPRGVGAERGSPVFPFDLLERDRVAPPEVTALYEQAIGAGAGSRAPIEWSRVPRLPESLSGAVAQIMAFLAENELSALYVPAHFVPRIHPAYAEVSMFLATQMADEARHLDMFMTRARATGAPAVSSATTSRSLLFLLELTDFTEASFLLSVLGEGTFLDLLRFVEVHAPDEVTAEVANRARADEARHVHFGMAHVRHALHHVSGTTERLTEVVARRAGIFAASGGVPPRIQDALVTLAARGTSPDAIAQGHRAYRSLLEEMDDARVKRLTSIGFDLEAAQRLSGLHTPNFM